jgi:hypothetical protein
MFLPFSRKYKIPLLLSLAVFFIYAALRVESNWISASFALLGSFLAIFLLDLEYFAFTYLIEPSVEKSRQLKELVSSKQYKNAFLFINQWEQNSIDEEMTIRSAMFQVLMYLFAFYFVSTLANGFVICLSLSILANLLYLQIIEFVRLGNLKRWFWIYTGELTKDGYFAYLILCSIALFVLCAFL